MTSAHVAELWLAIGFIGQAIFGARFFIQWLYSEKEKRSVIPEAFWYISVMGGIIMWRGQKRCVRSQRRSGGASGC
ncbi:MAG: lipid-A-disaccharide synthase N-terminal domain-containing protein [Pseudomonadota bacterium]